MSLINTVVNVFGNGVVRGIPLKLLRKRNIQKQPWQHWVVSQVRCACQDFLSAVTRVCASAGLSEGHVKHHIKEEEAELFARARTGKLDLVALGREIMKVKASWRPATTKRSQDKRKTDGSAPVKRSTRSRRMKGKSAKIPTKRAAM